MFYHSNGFKELSFENNFENVDARQKQFVPAINSLIRFFTATLVFYILPLIY